MRAFGEDGNDNYRLLSVVMESQEIKIDGDQKDYNQSAHLDGGDKEMTKIITSNYIYGQMMIYREELNISASGGTGQ